MFLLTGFACVLQAQVYQVNQGASQSPQAAKSAPAAQSQSAQSLGWGSNIQNARLARAAQMALQHGDKAQAVDYAQRAAQSAPNDPQLWFLLGYAARVDGRYQLSLDSYNHGLRLNPGSLDGQSGVAQDYNLMGRANEAEKLLQKIIAADPHRRNDVLLLGEINVRARDYTTALNWLSKAERLHPDARSELLMALCYQQLKQMNKARLYLDMAKRRAPNNPDVLRSLAGFYRDTGNYSAAIDALRQIPHPGADVLAELGYTYQLDGKMTDSAQVYEQAANAKPKDLNLQLAAAQAQVAAGAIPQADPFLRRAQNLDPNYYRLHAIRGEIAQMQDRTQEAQKEYQLAIRALPAVPVEGPLYGIQLHMDLVALDRALGQDDPAQHELATAQKQIAAVDQAGVNREQFLRLRALIRLNAGDAAGALTDIRDALAANPNDRNNLQLNGDILMKLGRTQDAIAVYRRILHQDPSNRFALTSLGYAERAAGDSKQAEKYFLRLAKADPKLYVPYLALGDLYTSEHHYDKAQAEYTRALKRAPHNALVMAGGMNAAIEAHNLKLAGVWLGRTTPEMDREPQVLREKERYYSFKGDYRESAAVGERAIQVLPRDRDVVVYLGYDYLYLNRYNELLALTTKYMNLLPKETDIPLLQGYVYKHDGQKEKARDAFAEAIQRDPTSETAYVNRGYMENDLGQAADAANDFKTAVKLDPKDGQAHLGLAYADLDLHQTDAALHQASLAEKSMGDIRDVHVIRATAYGREGMQRSAATEYRAALKFTPHDGALYLGLGNALLSLRQYRPAIDALNRAARYSPQDPNPDAMLASAYAHLNDRQQALHFANIAEQRASSSPGPVRSSVYVTTGQALSSLGDQTAAMQRFSKALAVKGSDRVGVRLAIAQLMAQQNHPHAAERQVALGMMEADAGDTAPPTGSEYIAAADIFRTLHEYDLSQNYLHRAKMAGAPDAEVRIGLANNYLAVGDTRRAAAELAAVSATNADGDPSYQFLMAQANVYRQEHRGALALTSFAQAANAEGDDQSAEESMIATGGDEGLRVNPHLSVLSDYTVSPIYEDTTVYVLDSKLDANQPIPPGDFALLPGPRSSLQNQWTDAFHLHWKHLPTPAGFFQIRNARGPISAPSSSCGPGSSPSSICTLIINRDTTDYNFNIGLNPNLRVGRNMFSFNGGVQGTIRRDSLQPAEMNQNLFLMFLYGSTSTLFNAVQVSGYVMRETGPFTQTNLYSRSLTGALDFRVASPWSKTTFLTGWGANKLTFTPQTYQAYFTSAYAGVEHHFNRNIDFRALLEDLRAWRIVGANSGIAQNLRPAATFNFSPHRNWQVHLDGAYSDTLGFHDYDAVQSGISVSYAMPFRRGFEGTSGPLKLAYPIRFSAGVQDMDFVNFNGPGQQQVRPYFEISIF